MKLLRVYHGRTMKHEQDIHCQNVILAVEYISDKSALAISLSDRSILFHDVNTPNYKIIRKFYVPST